MKEKSNGRRIAKKDEWFEELSTDSRWRTMPFNRSESTAIMDILSLLRVSSSGVGVPPTGLISRSRNQSFRLGLSSFERNEDTPPSTGRFRG